MFDRLPSVAVLAFTVIAMSASAVCQVPLSEHPRPDWKRPDWIGLNGSWAFRFDTADTGIDARWYAQPEKFDRTITVPFSWGAPLSGLDDEADIGWYAKSVTIPESWEGKRYFLVVGAADWKTTLWIDGRQVGEHRGGYTPFEFELTDVVAAGTSASAVLRIDDTPQPYKLEGKQGYGPARGVWQPAYLEARGKTPLAHLHLTPDLSSGTAHARGVLLEPAAEEVRIELAVSGEDGTSTSASLTIARGDTAGETSAAIADPILWTLENPHLYHVEATVDPDGVAPDVVSTYFGMREISVVNLPGTDHRYVALNGDPVYLQMALDQAYHPEGYYTFPSDEFMRDEILRSKRIGLNGMRIHVKIGHPRKLYWADRLGMLIMADVPNSWGEPNAEMRREVEYALTRMIERDYNHPSIFSWVPFNETWGLFTEHEETGRRVYSRETQDWVTEVVELAKSMDPTRLVEDNSVCCGRGHTVTDLNSWHSYLPGWAWTAALDSVSRNTYPGSSWNFEEGYVQADQPNINSEFGNVWGYEGSTGDVDWTWDYHRALNAFRAHPKIAGWLYTEHHDVVNEWNGYWRYDRSEKITGLGSFVDGMSLRDLHAPLYIIPGDDLCTEVVPGDTVEVPIRVSFMSNHQGYGDTLRAHGVLYGWDAVGRYEVHDRMVIPISYEPWLHEEVSVVKLAVPDHPGLFVFALELIDEAGTVQHRNFTTFVAKGETPATTTLFNGQTARVLSFDPAGLSDTSWSLKQWNVLDGLKVNGAGSGWFEYRVPWPENLDPSHIAATSLVFEASAKQLFGKDREDVSELQGDYMRGRGTHDPSRNPNAYPMTDETRFPSFVRVLVGERHAGSVYLPDDPADHRGVLSWHAQRRDRKLREAGSYGDLVRISLPPEAIREAARAGEIVVRMEVDDALPGGMALYGKDFGRYPVDPTFVFTLRD